GVIRAVAAGIRRWRLAPLVVDPVMVATSGDRLLEEDAVAALVADLLPLAALVTPNLPEAEVLAGHAIRDRDDLERAARRVADHGAATVLVKGGHRAVPGASEEGEANDWLWDGSSLHTIEGPRIETTSTHGTGCTLSAAIAVRLAAGDDPLAACIAAKAYLAGALSAAEPLGNGRGPVDHLWRAAAPVR
ncbi:MAG: hydroxymethylpyrimidine/phosphomethylpyrimidine kinase, partial [Candidatus Limnocylindria bacterium]